MISDFFSREVAQLGKDAIETLNGKNEKVATVTKCEMLHRAKGHRVQWFAGSPGPRKTIRSSNERGLCESHRVDGR